MFAGIAILFAGWTGWYLLDAHDEGSAAPRALPADRGGTASSEGPGRVVTPPPTRVVVDVSSTPGAPAVARDRVVCVSRWDGGILDLELRERAVDGEPHVFAHAEEWPADEGVVVGSVAVAETPADGSPLRVEVGAIGPLFGRAFDGAGTPLESFTVGMRRTRDDGAWADQADAWEVEGVLELPHLAAASDERIELYAYTSSHLPCDPVLVFDRGAWVVRDVAWTLAAPRSRVTGTLTGHRPSGGHEEITAIAGHWRTEAAVAADGSFEFVGLAAGSYVMRHGGSCLGSGGDLEFTVPSAGAQVDLGFVPVYERRHPHALRVVDLAGRAVHLVALVADGHAVDGFRDGRWTGLLCAQRVAEWNVRFEYGGRMHEQCFPGGNGSAPELELRVDVPTAGVLRLVDAADGEPIAGRVECEIDVYAGRRPWHVEATAGLLDLSWVDAETLTLRLAVRGYEPIEIGIDPAGPGPWPREVVLRRKS